MLNLIYTIITTVKLSYFKLFNLLFLFVLLSALDLLGISLLVPLLQKMVFGIEKIIPIGPKFIEDVSVYFGEFDNKFLASITLAGFFIRLLLSLFVVSKIAEVVQSQRISLGIRSLKNNLSREYLDHIKYSASENVYLIQTLSAHLVGALQALLKITSDLVLAIILLSFLFIAEPLVFASMVVFFGLVGMIFYLLTGNKAIKMGKNINEAEEQIISIANDATSNFKEAKLLKKMDFFVFRLEKQLNKVRKNTVVLQIVSASPRLIMEFAFLFFFLLMWSFGNHIGLKPEEMMGISTAYALVGLRLLPIVTSTSNLLLRLRAFEDSVRLYAKTNNTSNSTQKAHLAYQVIKEEFNTLKLMNVSFGYPGSDLSMLKSASASFKKGEIVGIFGASGVGKSTLLNIISGLIVPSKGKLLFNDLPVENEHQLHSVVGYVPQKTTAISGTILENIILEDVEQLSPKNSEKLKEIIELTGLSAFLETLPDGLYTRLDAHTLSISGGQWQRIAVARAIYHSKDIVIFDEATSALDEKSEIELINGIRKSNFLNCLILVSHRSSTQKICDRVYTLCSDGRLMVSS